MKSSFFRAAIATFAAAAVCMLSPLGAHASGATHTTKKADDTYMIVQILDKYKIITTAHLTDEVKKANDDYKDKLKEWQDDRKTDPNTPRPPKPIVKKIKTNFLTQDGAQKALDKILDDEEKKGDKKDDKANK